jgi:DnaJ-class molecular chaperone
LTRDQETAVLYTHYDYLELPPGASSTCIEVAYHTLKQRLNGDAEEMLVRLIHEAYAVLSDPDRRRVYDTALQRDATDADAELTACLDQQAALRPRHVQDVPAPLIAAISAWAA